LQDVRKVDVQEILSYKLNGLPVAHLVEKGHQFRHQGYLVVLKNEAIHLLLGSQSFILSPNWNGIDLGSEYTGHLSPVQICFGEEGEKVP
jgi:hypothetical protein